MKPTRSNPLFAGLFRGRSLSSAIVATVTLLASQNDSSAANQTYLDTSPLNTWNTTDANWDAGIVWTNGNTAIFGGTGESLTVSTVTTNGITFNSAGYTLGGGTITLSASSTVTAAANATINSAIAGGAFNLTKTGAGTLTLGGTQSYTGNFVLQGGGNAVFASGFGTTTLASIWLTGTSANSQLTIEAGSTSSVKYIGLGDSGTNQSGRVDQTGGNVTVNTAGNNFRVGHWDNGASAGSVYNLSGGNLDTRLCTATVSHDGTGDMNVGGSTGTATWQAGLIQFDAGGADTKVGRVNLLANGVLETYGNLNGSNASAALEGFHLAGGTARAMANTTWAPAVYADANSTVNANGFTVTLTGSVSGTSDINLSSATGTFALSTTGTQTVTAPLSGSTAITKIGTGTTTLSGVSSHTGTLAVNAGRLNVAAGGSIASTTTSVASGATLGGEGSIGGTVSPATGSFLAVDPTTPGGITFNSLNLTGQPTVVFSSVPSTAQSPVTLFTYTGTLTSPGGLATDLKGLSGFTNPVVTDTSGVVTLSFSTQNLTWAGPGNVWDLKTTANWGNAGAQTFAWGDAVLFDDSAGVPTNITLAGELQPGSIVVNSATNNFTITGSAGNFLSGTGSLLKSGSSILTMNGVNTFTGGVIISQGTIQVQSAGALGAGNVTLGDSNTGSANTALYIDTNRVNFVRPVIISANGTGTATLGTRSNVTGAGASNGFTGITLARNLILDSNAADRTDYSSISGTGNLTVTGTGRTVFTNANTFTGNLTISPSGTGGNLQNGVATASATNYIPDTTSVTVTDFPSATQAEFRLSSQSETINGLNGNGTVDTNSINTTLTLGGGGGNGNFTGNIQNGGASVVTLAKSGAGNQILSGTNTYTGTTTVSAGVLQFGKSASVYNGTTASWTPANLRVSSGATLAVNIGGTGEFSTIEANLLLNNLRTTITNNGLQAGSFFGFNTANATGAVTFSDVIANSTGTGSGSLGVRKLGAGTLILGGASTYTGTTAVDAGTLEITNNASGTAKLHTVAAGATLQLGYSTSVGFGYGCGVTVNGTSVGDATGLYLKGGTTSRFGDTLTLQTAPSTVRAYSTGSATLGGGDVNRTYLSAAAAASGSVVDSSVNILADSYGYRLATTSGSNTATGDLVIQGVISGSGSNNNGGPFATTLRKEGSGSVRLTGANTYGNGVYVGGGSVIVGGADNRLPTGAGVILNSGTFLKLDGVSQTVSALASNGTGGSVVGMSTTLSNLTLSSASDSALAMRIGGSGTNENNLSFSKSGTGILTLSNVNNSYGGGTFVNGGTLRVNDPAGTVAGTGTVTVNSGGTLDGYGVLNNSVVVSASGGTVAGGIGASSLAGDMLTVDSLSFAGTGTLRVAPNVTQVAVTNQLEALGAAGSVTVDIGTAPLAVGTYTLATHSGPIGGTGLSAFTIGTNPGGPFTYALSDNGSELQLTVSTSALFWDGFEGAEWTLTNNWRNGGGDPVTFSAGAAVVFNDAAFDGDVVLSSGDVNPLSVAFTNSDALDYTLTGTNAITGSSSLLKSGNGSVTISNTNTFTGDVTINLGTLNAATIANSGVGSALGSGSSIVLNGGTLGYAGTTAAATDRSLSVLSASVLKLENGNLSLDGVVSGSGALTKSGTGALTLTNAGNTLTGNLSVTGGSIQVDDTAKLGSGSLTLAGGALALSGSSAITTSKAIALGAGGGTIQVTNTAGVIHSGPITGNGGFTKTGAGTLTFSTNKNFSGGVTVNEGTLYITAGGWYTVPFGQVNTLTINPGGTVETAGAHTLGTDQIPIVINGGTLKLGREQYATTLQMTGGLVTGNSDPSTQLRNWGGTMSFFASSTGAEIATPFNLVGNAVLNVQDGTATDDLLISGPVIGASNLTKTGDGKLVLKGTNTNTGNVIVNGGSMELHDAGRLTFAIPASGVPSKITGSGNATFNGDFHINVAAASTLTTGTWSIEEITGTATYGSTFQVVDADGTPWAVTGDTWSRTVGSQLWTYDEAAGTVTLAIAVAGYDDWKTQIADTNQRGRTDDPDSDGLTNLQEFLFGTDPSATTGTLVDSTTTGGNLVLKWLRREDNAGYSLLESTTLGAGSWTASSVIPAADGDQSGVPANYDRWTATIPLGTGSRFFRVEGVEN